MLCLWCCLNLQSKVFPSSSTLFDEVSPPREANRKSEKSLLSENTIRKKSEGQHVLLRSLI